MLDKDLQNELIENGRSFLKFYEDDKYADFESDQDLKKPQPPLVKERMRDESESIDLPKDYENLTFNNDILSVFKMRKSSRVYTQKSLNLRQLSFLLWATQGVKDIRGKSYATLRTVPSGGARHGFETYLLIKNVEGLKPGKYHYLPMFHQLEYLESADNINELNDQLLCGQVWANKANIVFYWSIVPYRCEWRYGIYAHRVALMDVGHMCQNLYLACSSLGLGTCGIAAVDIPSFNKTFEIDGEEEFGIYAAPVGTIDEKNKDAENAFYNHIKEQGL